jgi:hypothetical protein
MNDKPAPIWIAGCILAFGLVMAGIQLLLSGFDANFTVGLFVGLALGIGGIGLLVRDARRLP